MATIISVKKKSSKKEEILKIAASMFRERGFAATSMRDLAENIGIEAASLYNHIDSKSQMLEDIIAKISKTCNEHLDELEAGKASALQKVESIIRFHIKMMMLHFEEYSVMVSQWMLLEAPKLSAFITARRKYVKRMETIVQQGIDDGEIKPLLPYVVVLNILSAVRGLEFWQKSAKTHSAEDMEMNMVQHLMEGLKA